MTLQTKSIEFLLCIRKQSIVRVRKRKHNYNYSHPFPSCAVKGREIAKHSYLCCRSKSEHLGTVIITFQSQWTGVKGTRLNITNITIIWWVFWDAGRMAVQLSPSLYSCTTKWKLFSKIFSRTIDHSQTELGSQTISKEKHKMSPAFHVQILH